ncbi:crotonase/enoyl-CoA hydratase family protein [Smaragdicoccus niigatensis]|uniref:crotonase/enoyl-CoA hydratase family protein n=1 Tax=Smaragdicoccus niigatensis TaxID=359359 RepID=UPI00037E0CD7|nr:crotonase/enoyl-CoA hydratase family protein [Smaragdicoccus niigatensis]
MENTTTDTDASAAWRAGWTDGDDSLFAARPTPTHDHCHDNDRNRYRTLTYEVTGRIARIIFNRPEQGNSITWDTPTELAGAVERADLDPRVHVIVVSGRGKGFCGGYDLSTFGENGFGPERGVDPDTHPAAGTVLDPVVQARNHTPDTTWDPMLDYAMMSRFNRGFASLLHANKPTVAKLHGFAVAGGTDIALYADQIICADDTKIGYPPTRVWGIPAAGMWAHRLGDQRAKRLLLTGDCLSGAQAADWGLAVESVPTAELDQRTEDLLERIAAMPINQLMMVKLALNSSLVTQGVANSTMISTVFDGISRHTREGYAFQQHATTAGFRDAVRERDEPFGDYKRTQFQ